MLERSAVRQRLVRVQRGKLPERMLRRCDLHLADAAVMWQRGRRMRGVQHHAHGQLRRGQMLVRIRAAVQRGPEVCRGRMRVQSGGLLRLLLGWFLPGRDLIRGVWDGGVAVRELRRRTNLQRGSLLHAELHLGGLWGLQRLRRHLRDRNLSDGRVVLGRSVHVQRDVVRRRLLLGNLLPTRDDDERLRRGGRPVRRLWNRSGLLQPRVLYTRVQRRGVRRTRRMWRHLPHRQLSDRRHLLRRCVYLQRNIVFVRMLLGSNVRARNDRDLLRRFGWDL